MSGTPIPQPTPDQLDEIDHPALGKLAFPKSMPFEQRNQIIAQMESEKQQKATADANSGNPVINFLAGAAKQAGRMIFSSGGIGQGGVIPSDQQSYDQHMKEAADMRAQGRSPLNPLNYTQGQSLSNVPGNLLPDIKAMNPIAPAFDNPNTAQGLGESFTNLLAIRQNLRRLPAFGAPRAAAEVSEIAQPLNPMRPNPTNAGTPTAAQAFLDRLLPKPAQAATPVMGDTVTAGMEQAPKPVLFGGTMNRPPITKAGAPMESGIPAGEDVASLLQKSMDPDFLKAKLQLGPGASPEEIILKMNQLKASRGNISVMPSPPQSAGQPSFPPNYQSPMGQSVGTTFNASPAAQNMQASYVALRKAALARQTGGGK